MVIYLDISDTYHNVYVHDLQKIRFIRSIRVESRLIWVDYFFPHPLFQKLPPQEKEDLKKSPRFLRTNNLRIHTNPMQIAIITTMLHFDTSVNNSH